MSYPEGETVGSLMEYLQEQLKKGNIDKDTKLFVEIYSLTPEEKILKDHEKELGYHIPDESPWEICTFRTGVWQGVPEGQSRDDRYSNTVALSCYVRQDDLNEKHHRISSSYWPIKGNK